MGRGEGGEGGGKGKVGGEGWGVGEGLVFGEGVAGRTEGKGGLEETPGSFGEKVSIGRMGGEGRNKGATKCCFKVITSCKFYILN